MCKRRILKEDAESEDIYICNQGWGAEAGCFWLLGSGAVKKKQELEPEPLGKKSEAGAGAGARATKKLAGSSALLEDKKNKETVRLFG